MCWYAALPILFNLKFAKKTYKTQHILVMPLMILNLYWLIQKEYWENTVDIQMLLEALLHEHVHAL